MPDTQHEAMIIEAMHTQSVTHPLRLVPPLQILPMPEPLPLEHDEWEDDGWEDSSNHCGDCGAYAARQRIDDDGSIEYRCEACGWSATVDPEDRS